METSHSHSTTVERYHTKISISANSDRASRFSSPDDAPAASPLDSLEAVLSWSPGADDFCVPVIPLKGNNGSLLDDPAAPKLIVCHDMMGGYKKDRFVQGHLGTEDYYLYHWQHISAFIYFSHHFITLPPPTWTNAAHRNGTLSMGTIITEWQEGAKLCHQLFSSEVTLMHFSQQLVALAQYYRFDGWLVNIENPIHPNCVANLYMFLSLLTTGMHEACPGSKVIWYDSVTVSGELKWQNQLNKQNKPFFDLCDGIFLNYNWNGGGLGASRELAGGRKGEVYVGIDVFGRGCFGGGGYNSDKALQVISDQSLSAAIFAPGWVFETQDKANFFQNEDKFWTLLSPYCPPSTPLPLPLPLVSSFGRGCGDVIAIDGKVVYEGPWTNLSAQDLQPSFTGNPTDFDPQRAINVNGVTVNTKSAYSNGASLKLQGRFRKGGSAKLAVIRLFKVDISLREPLFLAYTFSGDLASGVRHYIQLKTSSKTVVLLDPNTAPAAGSKPSELLPGYDLPRSHEVPLPSWCSHHLLAPLPEHHSRALHRLFTGSSKQVEAWRTSYFLVQCEALSGAHVEEVSIALCPDASGNHKPLFGLDIGELKILDPRCLSPDVNPSTITNIHCKDVQCYRCHQHPQCTNDTLSLTLKWITIDDTIDPVEHCNIYSSCIFGNLDKRALCWQSDYVYLGRAYASCFRVIGLDLFGSELEFSFEFRVQPVTVSQRKPGVEESPCIVVQVTP